MRPESPDPQDYLACNDVVDWTDPEVYDVAQQIAGQRQGDIEISRALFEWVRDHIGHSVDIAAEVVTCSASEVLSERTGLCYAKSHLLAAMLRSRGIPAGFCYQVLRKNEQDTLLVLHGFNGIYLASRARWIRVDARGNTDDINAQFGIETEQLAFPVRPELGEFTYETIFVTPAAGVVHALRKYRRTSDLLRDVPNSL
ncbi:MAG: transglutaminase-like domain-containing protein [Thermodesulfobacteriota bacterium]